MLQIKGIDLRFETDTSLFSPEAIDRGTLAMLSVIDFMPEDKVLDLGCGYGIVGILAAKMIGEQNVIMCDISDTAVACAKENASLNSVPDISIKQSNGFESITETGFTLILSNPPYHTDFAVAKHFIEVGFKKLSIGGRLVMVTKRLDWYKNKLTSVFGGVKVHEIDGYYVFISEKRSMAVSKKERAHGGMSRKLMRKHKRNKS